MRARVFGGARRRARVRRFGDDLGDLVDEPEMTFAPERGASLEQEARAIAVGAPEPRGQLEREPHPLVPVRSRWNRLAPAIEEIVRRARGEPLVDRALVPEMDVEGPGRDVRDPRHLARRRGVVAARAEHLEGGVEEPRFGRALPPRRTGLRRRLLPAV